MDEFDICIIGAGAVGLAVAYQLSEAKTFKGKSIVVLERESSFGQHISSRNSEVIHAGIYYAQGSLKARLCVRGKELLYEHCDKFDIPQRRIGKIIVAQKAASAQLESIKQKAEANGVTDLEWMDRRALQAEEPALNSELALHSPSTGIVDSHSYMQSLLNLAQANGVSFAPFTSVDSIEYSAEKYAISTTINANSSTEEYNFKSAMLVNSAGLEAQSVAKGIAGIDQRLIPELHLCKGDYFSYQGRNPFRHLIYPIPELNEAGLGIHSTVDLGGQLKFGPDSNYVDSLDYTIDGNKAADFVEAIARYFPSIKESDLLPAYSGIRPKLSAEGEAAADFQIQDGSNYDMPGLVQLFGIESPGLTASLALGEEVRDILKLY